MAPERVLALTAPVQSRILEAGTTVTMVRSTSRVPGALTSTAMRRVVRPGARLIRSLPFDAVVTPTNLLTRINAGEVQVVRPKTVSAGVVTVDQVAVAAVPPDGPASGWLGRLARIPWLPWVLIALGVMLLVLLSIVLPLGIGLVIGLAILAALIAFVRRLLLERAVEAPAASLKERDQTPVEVSGFPSNAGFVLSLPGAGDSSPVGGADSAVAARFKTALTDSFALIQASATVGRVAVPATLDLPQLTSTIVAAVDPTMTIPARVFSTISLPAWVSAQRLDPYGEVMAYLKIDLPMYQPSRTFRSSCSCPTSTSSRPTASR